MTRLYMTFLILTLVACSTSRPMTDDERIEYSEMLQRLSSGIQASQYRNRTPSEYVPKTTICQSVRFGYGIQTVCKERNQ